jgi:hypothetical protein
MDVGVIIQIISGFRSALGLVRDAKDLLPAHQQKPIEEALHKAEAAAMTAEAKLAVELGYRLCRCTWPPQIMTRSSHGWGFTSYENWRCARCWTTETVKADQG